MNYQLRHEKFTSSDTSILAFVSATVKTITTVYQKLSGEIVLIADKKRIFYKDDQSFSIIKSLNMSDFRLVYAYICLIATVNTFAGRTYYFFPEYSLTE